MLEEPVHVLTAERRTPQQPQGPRVGEVDQARGLFELDQASFSQISED